MSKIKNILINLTGAALLAAGLAQAAGATGFDGNFGSYAGAHYDGGTVSVYDYNDYYTAIAVSSTNVYAALSSGYTGSGSYGLHIVKYDLTGNTVLSSAPYSAGSVNIVRDMTVTPYGVYAVDNVGTGYYVVKYGFDAQNPYAASASVSASTGSAITYDPSGNIYVAGWQNGNYKIVKFDSNLSVSSSVVFDAGGADYGTGIAFGAGSLYVIGVSSQAGDSYLVLAKFNPADLSFVSSATWTGGAFFSPDAFTPSPKLAFNPVTSEIAAVATKYSAFPAREVMTARFSSALVTLGVDYYSAGSYPLGTSVAVDPAGNILAGVKGYDGVYDFGAVIKYTPALSQVGVSTFAAFYASFVPFDIAVDSSSGVYAAGIIDVGDNGIDAAAVKMPAGFSAPQQVEGSENLKMLPDGNGGAFLVYDSTVSADGQRMLYARRVDASNASVWAGAVALSSAPYYSGTNDMGLAPDGNGGILVGWFANGFAYAQRVEGDGTLSWGPIPAQVSTRAVEGGMFAADPAGGMYIMMGYASHSGMTPVAQRLDYTGQCQWPVAGNCVTASTGTALPMTDFSGRGNGFSDGAGNFWFAWGGMNGQNMDLYAVKLNSSGDILWGPATMAGGTSYEGATAVDGTADGAGGMYLVWTTSSSSTGYLPRLVAQRFDSDGSANPGWSGPLQLSQSYAADNFLITVARDQDGFAVLFGTTGYSGGGELRVIRSSAASADYAPGWTLGGQLLGPLADDAAGMVYDGSYYHIAWNENGLPGHDIVYQRMSPDGAFFMAGSYLAGTSTPCLHIAISTDGAGGALVSWMSRLGGAAQPELVSVPANAGPTTVSIAAADISPAIYLSKEEAAALSVTPYTNNGTASFSGLTVSLGAANSNFCAFSAAGLYYDTDESGAWDAGDRLVSSAALSCQSQVTFAASELVTTQQVPYFVTLKMSGGEEIAAVIASSASFQFSAPMADQGIYPIASVPRSVGNGSEDFKLVQDGAGGAYAVYDSTVGAGGQRQIFVQRFNTPGWGPVAVSAPYYPVKGGDVYAMSDSTGGVYAAWFDGGGLAMAQHLNAAGDVLWTPGGVQISSGATDGGEFRASADGGFFAIFGYPTGAGMVVAAQKVNYGGQCLWPDNVADECVTASTGTRFGVGDFSGRGAPVTASDGSLWFAWGGLSGPNMQLNASKISASGAVAWELVLSSGSGVDMGATAVDGVSDGAGGVYLLWSSSSAATGNAPALVARRFASDGSMNGGWAVPLQLTQPYYTDDFKTVMAADQAGFAVLYATSSYSGGAQLRVVRSSDVTNSFASGWAQDGQLVGLFGDNTSAMAFDGANYHIAWNQYAQVQGHQINYQRMSPDGVYAYAGGMPVGNSPECLTVAIATSTAGGAMLAWKDRLGGDSLPYAEYISYDAQPGPQNNGAIYGSVSYGGYMGGDFHIAISTIASDIYPESITYASATMTSQGAFSFTGLLTPATYYIQTWKSYGGHAAGDPSGAYNSYKVSGGKFESAPLFLTSGASASGVDLTLLDFGAVSGVITAGVDAPVRLAAATAIPGYLEHSGSPQPSTGAYTTYLASSPVPYTLSAWIDADFDETVDAGELFASTSVTINYYFPSRSGVDLALAPYLPAAGHTGDFSTSAGAGFDSGNMDAGMDVVFYGGYVYAVGASTPGSVLVKYDEAGVIQSSAVFAAAAFSGLAVNANGVYAAGGSASSYAVARFDHQLQLSTAVIVPGEPQAAAIALDQAGNAYVAAKQYLQAGEQNGAVVKYDQNLVYLDSAAYSLGGEVEPAGIVVDSGSVYLSCYQVMSNAYGVLKADAATLTLSTSVFKYGYVDPAHPIGGRLAVNPVTHGVYQAISASSSGMQVVRYSQDLAELGSVTPYEPGLQYAQGADVTLDAAGNVYLAGAYNLGQGADFPAVFKYSPSLVFLSSAGIQQPYGFIPFGLTLSGGTGSPYVTGVYFSSGDGETESTFDMKTVRYPALPGEMVNFSGVFAGTAGALFNGGEKDYGLAAAVAPGGFVYTAGASVQSGVGHGIIVRYDGTGLPVSSATLPYQGDFGFNSMVRTAGGVYAAGSNGGTGLLARYNDALQLVSSRTYPVGGVFAGSLAADAAGNIYAAFGREDHTGYSVAKFDASLALLISAGVATGAQDGPAAIAVSSSGYVYVNGVTMSTAAALPYYATFRLDSALNQVGYAAFSASVYAEPGMPAPGIAVSSSTGALYIAGTLGMENARHLGIIKYNADLSAPAAAELPGDMYDFGLGLGVAVAQDGYIYALGKEYDGVNDFGFVAKYTPSLLLLSSQPVAVHNGLDYMGFGVAVATSGYVFVAGVDEDKYTGYADMRTVRLGPLPGAAPAVYVAYESIAPAVYNPGVEAPALKLQLRTDALSALISGLRVQVNPAGSYSDIVSVALYLDGSSGFGDGSFDAGDTFISSAAVSSGYVVLPTGGGDLDVSTRTVFLTLVPAVSAAGGSVSLAIEAASDFLVSESMAAQAIYPLASQATAVELPGDFTGDFSLQSGAVFNGADDYDIGTGLARYAATGDLYATGVTMADGVEQAMLVRYSSAGVKLAMEPLTDLAGVRLLGAAVNANGVYVSGGVIGQSLIVARYTHALAFVSSATAPGVYDAALALDAAGSVYAAGMSDNSRNFHLYRYSPALLLSTSAVFDVALGSAAPTGLAADNGFLYVTGKAWNTVPQSYIFTARFSTGTLAMVSSAAYSGAYINSDIELPRLAVNPVSHNVYVAGTVGSMAAHHMAVVRYDAALQKLGEAAFTEGGSMQHGFDVAVDSLGYVYALGSDPAGYERAALVKLSPALVFVASAAYSAVPYGNFMPLAMALDRNAGRVYATGGGLTTMDDMRTVRFPALTALLPVVHVAKADLSPESYLAGQEGAALQLRLYTNSGNTELSNIRVAVSSSMLTGVALYRDTGNGFWDQGDQFVSSAPVTGPLADLPVAQEFGGVSPSSVTYLITLTPAPSAEGSSVRVTVLSSAAFTTLGDMAADPVYPAQSALKPVRFLERVTDLTAGPGASLAALNLSWTYPQDITSGRFMVRYSTDPADFASGPSVYNYSEEGISVTSGTVGTAYISALTPVTDGLRVYPYYAAAWLFNGTSTSAVSNLTQNLYYPAASVVHQDAAVKTRPEMFTYFSDRALLARGPSGPVSAVSFNDNGKTFIALTGPDGRPYYYSHASEQLQLKDLAVDPSGNAYALVQKGPSPMVIKVSPAGAVLWSTVSLASETAKALAYGSGAVYVGMDFWSGVTNDFKLSRIDASNGAWAGYSFQYDGPGGQSYDEVNGLAFVESNGVKNIYAAGAGGQYSQAGRVHKFEDTGSTFTAAGGNWPVQYANPSGDSSRALVIKADQNGNVLVAGTEQRWDLNQGANIWLNRYNAAGASVFPAAARYNNPQGNSEDVPAALEIDSFGSLYVAGYSDMWTRSQGYDLLLLKFSPAGLFNSARTYDSGNGAYDMGTGLVVSTDNYVHVAGSFGGVFGVYSAPLGASVNTQFLSAAEGAYTGTVDLMWNYVSALPAGATYYIKYTTAAAVSDWSSLPVRSSATVGPQYAGAVQLHQLAALPTLRYPGPDDAETRGNFYKFKVWVGTVALGEAQSYAKTPKAYDDTRYYDNGRERLSFLSGISGPPNAIAVAEPYVYHAFAGFADGGSTGFGFRRYNADQYLEWTKFYNGAQDRRYQVNSLTRDSAGNFYVVGSRYPVNYSANAPEILLAGKDAWIAKLNPAGDLLWSYGTDAGGLGLMDEFQDAEIEEAGQNRFLYVAGVSSTASQGLDVLARKYDVTSSTAPGLVWSQTHAGTASAGNDFGYGVAVGTGAVYVSATVADSGTGNDIGVLAFSKATGASSLTASVASGGDEQGYDIAYVNEGGAGYLYVAGSTAAFDGDKTDAALFKFNLLGAPVWSAFHNGRDSGDDAVYTVRANGSGIYVAGFETSNGNKNAIYREFAGTAGDMAAEWSRGFDFAEGADDMAFGLAFGASGRVYSAVSVWGERAGFYMFPEPNFDVLAAENYVPGSVRLDWMSRSELPAGALFRIQHSTYSSVVWSTASAQTRYVADSAIMEGESVSRVVYGLNAGRDALGNSVNALHYFRIWTATAPGGAFTAVSAEAAAARPSDAWAFETLAMYPNDAKLFVMGNAQQSYYYGSYDEREFTGIARDGAGALYSVANLDWNGSGGFGVKKFNSALAPQWTRFYAPGEWYQLKANRVAVDNAGYLYITGYERAPGADESLFVLKLGENGAVWKSTYSYSGGDNVGYGVAVDTAGSVYVAGSVEKDGSDDIFVARLNSSDGLFQSSATFGGSLGDDAAYGLAVNNGSVYVTGSSYEGGAAASLWLARLAASDLSLIGSTATVSNDPDGYRREAGYDVVVGTSGYVYVAGELFDPQTNSNMGVVLRSSANLAMNLATAPVNGLWAAYFATLAAGNNAAYGLAMDAAGSVYAAGVTERYDINQGENLWLRKYSQGGEELWSQEFHSASLPGDTYSYGVNAEKAYDVAVGTMGYVSVSARINGYYGLYRYKQTNTSAVNPTLVVRVSSGSASVPFPGVGVALIPYAATGGIEAPNIRLSVTDSSGAAQFQVPAGKQYFVALDRQGFTPSIKDQQMDPYGRYFVQLSSDTTRSYTLSPRAGDAYYPLTVTVTSAAAGDYAMAEVFFTQTGEKAAYGLDRVGVGRSSVTITVTNVPRAAAGAYTLGVTLPGRSLSVSRVMNAFTGPDSYVISLSTSAGAMVTSGGFETGASTTPAAISGVVRSSRTYAALADVRVRIYNESGYGPYNSYETLTDVNGKYSFYNVVSTPAAYYVTAQKAGYKRGYTRPEDAVYVTTASLGTVSREFRLDAATYTLRGYLRYNGVAVPNADVMVNGDYAAYPGSDSYRLNGLGIDADARTKTAADGSFLFSSGTANGLPDGQVSLTASFFGTWMNLNEGANVDNSQVDADDVRVVISSDGARWNPNNPGNCTAGRTWKLNARTGACQSQASGDIIFNILPPAQEAYATLGGSVTFVTTYPVTAATPLVISSLTPVTVMAMQESDSENRAMGFALISGTYTVNYATYSITLSTGVSYYTRINSSEWGELSSFDDRADFSSSATVALTMNFTVTKAGSMRGVVKLPDGTNYRPVYESGASGHRVDISVNGQNVQASEGWGVDEYGAFEFPNLPPGLYTVTLRPQGLGFRWATPTMTDIAVVAGKTTQVTMKLSDGLYVQPQIIGLPEISSTTNWSYLMIPVPSGTEMNQKKITELFFGSEVFSFAYSTATQTFEKKIMLTGQYDFYLMLGAMYNPGAGNEDPQSFDQFGNFIGKVKGVNVQRTENSPNLGTESQPIPVSVLGSLGQETLAGTIAGNNLYMPSDITRIISNMNEIFGVIPAVMIYDAAGDLRGYSVGMPSEADFPEFWAALTAKDPALLEAYFAGHRGRFMVPGLPPGRYTVVFNNPNYPPVAKEIEVPLAASYNGVYALDFDAQQIRKGGIAGTVTAEGAALPNATVYLKHKTVEKYAVTDSSGAYGFENLPPGIYRLEVNREGFVKTGQKTSLAGSLAGDDSVTVDFSLVRSQSNMSGKVYMSRFPSPVTRAGVKIVAYDETYNTANPTEYLPKLEATTNDAGEYELAGVVPGHDYKVTAFYAGKLSQTMDIDGETVIEGLTYLPDIVMRDVAPQIMVKARKSPDSANKVDVIIKSPKQLVTTPVCKVNPGSSYNPVTAVSLMLVPGPNNTYQSQFTVSMSQAEYTVYVYAGDGSGKLEKAVRYSPRNQAKTEQYIQDESIQGGEVQMDRETEEYSGIELDAGALTATSTAALTSGSGFGVSAYGPSADGLVGGFFSALPAVRTVKTEKGELSLSQAVQDLMASEVYDMELENAQANKPFTLTLKYDKERAGDNANMRIYKYDDATGGWTEVPGDYTLDPMLGVLSVGVGNLSSAEQGLGGVNTPLGRKRMGMSAVVNGRYTPSAGSATSQSGRFAVFTAMPNTGTPAFSAGFEVYNMPNPFNLKSKNVTLSSDVGASGIANPYPTTGTVIKYNLPAGKSGSLKLVIYNLAGEKVRTIDEGSRSGGVYYSEWDGRNDNGADCASGVYFMLTYLDGKQLGTKAHKMAIIK